MSGMDLKPGETIEQFKQRRGRAFARHGLKQLGLLAELAKTAHAQGTGMPAEELVDELCEALKITEKDRS